MHLRFFKGGEKRKLQQRKILKMPTLLFIFIFVLTCFWGNFSRGAASEAVKQHEVIFLIDVSNSMNTTDAGKLVPDCLEKILYLLPDNYAVGLVAYGTEVQSINSVDLKREAIAETLRQLSYTGYTNAGVGLEKALTLFKDSEAEKTVILLSDGEIMLDTPDATKVSEMQFSQAMQTAAQRGIRVLSVAIGEQGRLSQANIYNANNPKNGDLFHVDTVAELHDIAKTIVYGKFGIAKTSVSSSDLQNDALRVHLPLKHMEYINKAKISLTSTVPLYNVGADYTAQSGKIVSGKQFAVVNLWQPQSEAVQIRFLAANGGNVQADLILEMNASVQVEVKNTTLEESGQKIAEVRLVPVSTQNQNLHLLDDPYFEGKSVRVTADDQEIAAVVENGSIRFSLSADQSRSVEVKVHYEDLGVNMITPETISVQVKQAEGYEKLWIACIVIATVGLIWWRMREPKPLPPPPIISRYEYAGKFKIYITQTPDDSDIAPMEYNLYRNFQKEEITLGAILEQCGISFSLPGAYKIFFSPGANKALVLTNKSDCTILKNRDLLVKDHSCLVYFHERIHITFEDEHSELILEYKNVKPSERR